MDGEGSIGKAAVFEGDYTAIPDAHVGLIRCEHESIANALACFINSTLGQAQIEKWISGSTGQTQLLTSDLIGLKVPWDVIANATAIEREYRAGLRTFVKVTERVRRILAVGSAAASGVLTSSDTLDPMANRFLSSLDGADDLVGLLNVLRPEMF